MLEQFTAQPQRTQSQSCWQSSQPSPSAQTYSPSSWPRKEKINFIDRKGNTDQLGQKPTTYKEKNNPQLTKEKIQSTSSKGNMTQLGQKPMTCKKRNSPRIEKETWPIQDRKPHPIEEDNQPTQGILSHVFYHHCIRR